MYTIPELRLNTFELCSIPSPKELYQRIGFRSPQSSAGSVGKDGDFVEPINKVASNLDAIRIGERYADMARFDELRAKEAEANKAVNVEGTETKPADVASA